MALRSDYKRLREFGFHAMKIGSRHYMLLPKLNDEQTRILSEHLMSKGFSLDFQVQVTARSKHQTIHFERDGICWAAFDPADLVAPVIPTILKVRQQPEPLERLQSRYFRLGRAAGVTCAKFLPRIERSRLWWHLRASGECGLMPDELEVARFLLGRSKGPHDMLTDFPVQESRVRVIKSKLYFESSIVSSEALTTIRGMEHRMSRNSYLPKNCLIRLGHWRLPARRELNELLSSLGTWCGFVPAP